MVTKGFFGSLFDFSFENFVFPRIIKVLYAIAVVFVCVAYLGGVVYAFQMDMMYGIGAIVLGPIAMILYLTIIRVWMEIAIVLFRIYDNTNVIAGK
ncbi:MAG: DUF4282 domain-containing protein [Candidatus Aegiribacteria sp.]|nr:DUF4282 domain-containing protein [Candidatus Aegiribacteria sp.]